MFRRRRQFRRAPFRRFRRARTHAVVANQVWQRANFFFSEVKTVPNVSDTSTNTVFQLVTGGVLGDQATTTGRALSNAIRRIEVGGVVLWGGARNVDDVTDFLVTAPEDNEIYLHTALYVDRMNQLGVVPASMNWMRSQVPISSVPSVAAEDWDFPMKMLWRRWSEIGITTQELGNVPEGSLAYLNGETLASQSPFIHLNKRLRIRVDDFQALCFSFSYCTGPAYAASVQHQYRHWLAGSVYYRTIFG